MRAAKSRTVMLAGISITLWPFSLITHLRFQAYRPRQASGAVGYYGASRVGITRIPAGPADDCVSFARVVGKSVHAGRQGSSLFRRKLCAERPRQGASQTQ